MCKHTKKIRSNQAVIFCTELSKTLVRHNFSLWVSLKEVKCFKKNNRFQESYNVKYFKEIKRLKSLQKAEAYLEPKQASMMEHFNMFNDVLFLQLKLHHRCSTGLYIGLRKYWNFQIEAKLEQIIAIVTTHSDSCLHLVPKGKPLLANKGNKYLNLPHLLPILGKILATTPFPAPLMLLR